MSVFWYTELYMYYVYIIECSDGTLYIGSTNNIQKRIEAHNSSNKGAKYTRGRRPVSLRYSETFDTKPDALKRECELKKLSREQKINLILQV